MQENDFVVLFNGVLEVAKPTVTEDGLAKSLDDKLEGLQLDSLDMLMLGVYMSELYDISEADMKSFTDIATVRDYKARIDAHKQQDVEDIEEALETIR